MTLEDYLLTLFMEESSESIKAAGDIIRRGRKYQYSEYRGMTTEEIMNSEFGDCLANVVLLNQLGMVIAPETVGYLMKKEGRAIGEMKRRIERTMEIIEKNLDRIEIKKEEFKNFKDKINKLFEGSEEGENKEKIILKTY